MQVLVLKNLKIVQICGKIKIETAKSSFSEWESDIEIQIPSPIWVDYVRKARDPTSIAYHDNRSVDKLRY